MDNTVGAMPPALEDGTRTSREDTPEVASLSGAVAPRLPCSEHEADAIARMFVAGVAISAIAATYHHASTTIRSWLEGPLATRVEAARGAVLREVAIHNFELYAMLPQVRVALQGGLLSQDDRIRLETARWLHEQLIPKPTQRIETDLHVSGQVSHEVTGTLAQIATSLAEIREANAQRIPLARVRSGRDALPSPMRLPAAGPPDDAA
jgi:hypothetical protein